MMLSESPNGSRLLQLLRQSTKKPLRHTFRIPKRIETTPTITTASHASKLCVFQNPQTDRDYSNRTLQSRPCQPIFCEFCEQGPCFWLSARRTMCFSWSKYTRLGGILKIVFCPKIQGIFGNAKKVEAYSHVFFS